MRQLSYKITENVKVNIRDPLIYFSNQCLLLSSLLKTLSNLQDEEGQLKSCFVKLSTLF